MRESLNGAINLNPDLFFLCFIVCVVFCWPSLIGRDRFLPRYKRGGSLQYKNARSYSHSANGRLISPQKNHQLSPYCGNEISNLDQPRPDHLRHQRVVFWPRNFSPGEIRLTANPWQDAYDCLANLNLRACVWKPACYLNDDAEVSQVVTGQHGDVSGTHMRGENNSLLRWIKVSRLDYRWATRRHL